MPSRFATPDADALDLVFDGELWYWRGPSPFVFVRVPDDAAAALRSVASAVTYGWGMIPVTVRIGGTTFATSLFPKDGGYLVPIKVAVQRAERIATGDTVTIRLAIRH